jgi:hypothetical protein
MGIHLPLDGRNIEALEVGARLRRVLAVGKAALLRPENQAKLAAILTCHVMPWNATPAQVTKMTSAQSARDSQ